MQVKNDDNWQLKQVFLVSLLFRKVKGGGACLTLLLGGEVGAY